MQKSCSADKSTMYVDNIRQSSERMREMLNTLLDFFRLDNGKEQPNLSPCRISGSPDKPGGLSIQLCKSEKKEFYIRYSS